MFGTLSFRLPVAVFFLFSSAVFAACPVPSLRVALHDFPPYYQADTNGIANGHLLDRFTQLMDDLNCEWRSQFFSVPTLLSHLTTGRTDIALIIKHPTLEGRVNHSTQAIDELVLALYPAKGRVPINDLEALPKGAKLIVRRGYGYNGLINKLMDADRQLQLITADSHKAAVRMLNAERGDYLLEYFGPTEYYAERDQLYLPEGNRVTSWPIYVILSKQVRNSDRFLSEVDRWLEEHPWRSTR